MGHMKKWATAVAAIVVLVATLVVGSTPATALVAGGVVRSSAMYDGPAQGFSRIEAPIRITDDGGDLTSGSNYYMATEWRFISAGRGYMGLQNRKGVHWLNFSIWEADGWVQLNSSADCRDFTHEGSGVQCDMRFDWREGVTYTLDLRNNGGDRWRVSVVNESTGARTDLAEIIGPSNTGGIDPASIKGFVEEFSQGSEQLTSCSDAQPFAAVRYPVVADGTSPRWVDAETYGNCGHLASQVCDGLTCWVAMNGGDFGADRPPLKELTEIKHTSSGNCLHIDGTNVETAQCDRSASQRWEPFALDNGFALRNVETEKCLDVTASSSDDGANVVSWTCSGNPNQTFNWNGSALVAAHSDKCLEVTQNSGSPGANVQQATCDGGNSQKFNSPDEPGGGQDLFEMVARGTTGTERVGLQVDGVTLHTWTLSTTSTRYTHSVSAGEYGQVRIVYSNDGRHDGVDRNVNVSEVKLDGTSYRTEDLKSKGTWNGSDCDEGFRNKPWLHCNGWFEVISSGSPPPSSVAVEFQARGTAGSEQLTLEINGAEVGQATLTTSLRTYTFDVPTNRFANGEPTGAGNVVRVRFDNDGRDSSGADRNVYFEFFEYDGRRLDPTSLKSRGTWNGSDCGEGFRNKPWLHCNGWFELWG